MDNSLRIAIDGGAATGKTTVAKLIAQDLQLTYFNTGSMYRLITFFALQNNLLDNWKALIAKILKEKIYLENSHLGSSIKFNMSDLDSLAVVNNVSQVAAIKEIREFAKTFQVQVGAQSNVLLEGRDIGTIIMPDADFKFFLKVSPKEAARRRQAQNVENNISSNYEEILKSILMRNEYDSKRKFAPLVPAKDAYIIWTDNKSPTQIVQEIEDIIHGQKN